MWDRIKLVSSGIWNFLRPALAVFLTNVGPVLAEAALNAVTAAARTNGTGEQKREAAFQAITSDLAGQGVKVASSVINMAIETAVQKLKSDA